MSTKVPSRLEVERALSLIASRAFPVWIHCRQGLDRTGAVIGSYLVSRGADPERVIGELLDLFPARRRTPAFLDLWAPYSRLIRSFGRTGP